MKRSVWLLKLKEGELKLVPYPKFKPKWNPLKHEKKIKIKN